MSKTEEQTTIRRLQNILAGKETNTRNEVKRSITGFNKSSLARIHQQAKILYLEGDA